MKAARTAAVIIAASIGSAFLAQAVFAQAKTREQVRAELVQAQHDGLTPGNKIQYPPTPENLARQKQLHAITTHAKETAPSLDHHDDMASR